MKIDLAVFCFGDVAEWSNASHSKCDRSERVSEVRILPSPQWLIVLRILVRLKGDNSSGDVFFL